MVVTEGGNSQGLRECGIDVVLTGDKDDMAAYDALPPELRRTLRKLRNNWDARNPHEGLAQIGNPKIVAAMILQRDAENSREWQRTKFGEIYSDGVRTNDDDINPTSQRRRADGRRKARTH